MSNSFSGPEAAFDFLVEQQMWGQDGASLQTDLAKLAQTTINERGAYVSSRRTRVGGISGVIGSSHIEEYLIQGTEPVYLTGPDVALALRHGDTARAQTTHLVATQEISPAYLGQLSQASESGGTVATFEGNRLVVPHVEIIERRHVEAVDLLVSGLREALEPVKTRDGLKLRLPKINGRHAVLNDGETVNLREMQLEAQPHDFF